MSNLYTILVRNSRASLYSEVSDDIYKIDHLHLILPPYVHYSVDMQTECNSKPEQDHQV